MVILSLFFFSCLDRTEQNRTEQNSGRAAIGWRYSYAKGRAAARLLFAWYWWWVGGGMWRWLGRFGLGWFGVVLHRVVGWLPALRVRESRLLAGVMGEARGEGCSAALVA
jgi:hypothetical protein